MKHPLRRTLVLFESLSSSSKQCLSFNPATNNLNVKFTSPKQTTYAITIFDIQGKILLSKTGTTTSDDNNAALNIHALSAGMYILKLQYDHKTMMKKLVKE